MKLFGYITLTQLEYCFAIPVFEEAGKYFFQTLDVSGKVSGFEELDAIPETISLTLPDVQIGVEVGGDPVYVYVVHKEHILAGSRAEMETLLLKLLSVSGTPLFSKLEIAVFLKDRDLFNRYIDRIRGDWVENRSDFQGTLVLEGLDASEPTITITNKSEEQEIVRAIKLGLPDKSRLMETIMNASSPTIRAMVYSLGGGEELAKDIIQDTFIAFLDHIHAGTLKLESKISTFVYAIARNLTLSALRKNARTLMGRLEDQDEAAMDERFDEPQEIAMIVEERMFFTHEFISKLEEESTCVKLLLARFQPSFRSNAELALQFGYKDASVVSAQVHNCKKHLIKVIATNPILLCRAMDLLDDVHQLEPLVTKHANRLLEVFDFLQGRMKSDAEDAFQNEMEADPSLARLVMALKPRFSH